MIDRDDDLDPSDWLASQFAEEPPAPVTPPAAAPPAQPPTGAPPPAQPPAAPPASEPTAPVWPAASAPTEPPMWPTAGAPAAPPAAPPLAPEPPLWSIDGRPVSPAPAPWPASDPMPPAAAPPQDPWPAASQPPLPPAASQPPLSPPPVSPPPVAPPLAAPAPAVEPGGFAWGLTPGEDPAAVAAAPPPLIPPAAPPPLIPPAAPPPLIPPAAPPVVPPVAPPAAVPPSPLPPTGLPPIAYPPTAFPPVAPEPTVALTTPPPPPATPSVTPTASFSDVDQPTQAMPVVGGALEPRELDPSSWFSTPVDADLGGVTEVIEAEIIGLPTPEGEGIAAEGLEPTSGLDALFGETAFQEYEDTIVSAPPPRAPGGGAAPAAPKPPAAPIPRVQKILMIVAGSLVGVLALVALFVIGMRLSDSILPTPVASPTPTPTPTVEAVVLGPVPPGEYRWDELLGGECLATWEGAWTDTFEVVDCAGSHPAQMVGRGLFEETDLDPYPGFDVLLGRMNALCSAPTVLDYAVANQFPDLQIAATIPVDDADWDAGNRSWFCFVTRSSGADLSGSIAVPAVLPTPTPTPSAVPSTADPSATPGGRGSGSAPPK